MIHVSKISMKNFKSFKRMSLPIPEGFTAIVGPNGSGKSNIVDAICFVLGRSSAKSLRAERFSDLIFNGGKGGKPAKEAEVSLYFDNSSGEIPVGGAEIKVTRTVDTTGNSVYRMNGKRTSRAEILDALSAAHIRPDGHNIVLQGDITSLIEMSAVERREIIDEIAGIAEYDDKKRKATRELEKVMDNIGKVDAVMSEVKEQYIKLGKEKEDALRHGELKDKIKVAKATVLTSQNMKITSDIEELAVGVKEHEEKSARISKHIGILSTKTEVKRQEMEKISSDIVLKEETEQFQLFREIEKAKNEVARHDEKVSGLETEIEDLESGKERARLGIKDTKDEIDDFHKENKGFEGDIAKIQKDIAVHQKEVDRLYNEISQDDDVTAGQREKLAELREATDTQQGELLVAERRHALLQEKNTEKKRIQQETIREVDERKAQVKEMETTLTDGTARKKELGARLDGSSYEIKRLKEELMEVKGNLSRVSVHLEAKVDAHAKISAKYKALENISQRRLSFNRSIDEVLALRDKGEIKGIYGTISELGKVNPKFSRALSIAGGKGLEFIVVKDDKVAEKCINHLKERKIGRATFLPLNKISPRPPSSQEKSIAKDSFGFALDRVDFDTRYDAAFAYIFRNTVVIKDIATARKTGLGKARMVTLDGDLLEVSGSMSGGHYRPSGIGFEEVDASKKEVESLEKEVGKLAKERDALRSRSDELKEQIEALEAESTEGAREIEVLSERIKQAKGSSDASVRLLAEREIKLKELSSALRTEEKDLANYEKEIGVLVEKVAKLSGEKKALEEMIGNSFAEQTLREIKEKEQAILEKERTRETIKNQISLNLSKIEEILEPRITKYENIIASSATSREDIVASNEDILKQKKVLVAKKDELEREQAKITDEINALKKRRDFYAKGLRRITHKIDSLRDELDTSKHKEENARIETARLEARLEDVQNALKAFYDVKVDITEPIDTAEMEGEVAKMEVEMIRLEPINQRAIEDFELVREKMEKFMGRTERLTEERDSIIRLMEEIEARKMSVFMEIFENVAMNFARIFAKLSEGGSAEMVLDTEDPLDGGMEIRARPAGKNPQYIELMSGGEKTLTALAFIFAIQRFQPAPFYILDEIDVSLDKENEHKISELIADSSQRAQFIVVSHKDSLMASAAQLFGVSNEDGISKIIGVELEEVGD